MSIKYYAVKVGRKPGVYKTWDDCEKQVKGYSGAIYKSFTRVLDAQRFIDGEMDPDETDDSGVKNISYDNDMVLESDNPYAFIDGSYNVFTGVYGYGGFVVSGGEEHIISGSGNDDEMASMRNVAGEVLGCMAAVEKAIELGIKELDIYYDYLGIEMWATGVWKRTKKGTIAYYDYINSVKDKIKLNFVKVKGHSGIKGNERADELAKKAAGIV